MKGVVFTEFFDLVEESFSLEVADRIIQKSNLENDGAYTAVGIYDYCEMVSLVTHLGEETGLSVPDLLRTFGRHLFTRFHAGYPSFFEGVATAIEFLHKIENVIHVEVRKLYPDAELPTFEYEYVTPDEMHMVYRSAVPLPNLRMVSWKGASRILATSMTLPARIWMLIAVPRRGPSSRRRRNPCPMSTS